MSAAKTPGQVAQDARCNDAMTTEGHWEAIAAAVIAHHEATRPAWPPMRPMSDPDTPRNGVYVLLAFKVGHMAVMAWDDGLWWSKPGDRYAKDERCEGWWPLPEVQR